MPSPISRIRTYLGRRAFDSSTEKGRAAERHHRIRQSISAAVIARGTSIITALISLPLTLNYLGADRYGLWVTLSTFQVMLVFADLGMGNGVLNAVTRSSAEENEQAIRQYISTAYVAMSFVALGLIALFAGIYGSVECPKLYNVRSQLA